MRKRIESALWFAIENGPTILTIGFAAYVIALAQTSTVSIEVMLSWVLAILGLLAISELVERLRKLRNIEEMSSQTLQAVRSKFGERASAEDFFRRRLPPLGPYLEKATDICLSGVVLQRTTRENIDVLARRLKEGASVRLILVNPDGEAAQRIANPTANFPIEHLKANSQVTLQHIRWLSKLPERKGTIELRFVDEEPYFNIIAIDADKEYGVVFIEFYPQRWVHGSRPRMELTRGRDDYWFAYFKDQFDRLWQDGKSVPLNEENERQKINLSKVGSMGGEKASGIGESAS